MGRVDIGVAPPIGSVLLPIESVLAKVELLDVVL